MLYALLKYSGEQQAAVRSFSNLAVILVWDADVYS